MRLMANVQIVCQYKFMTDCHICCEIIERGVLFFLLIQIKILKFVKVNRKN